MMPREGGQGAGAMPAYTTATEAADTREAMTRHGRACAMRSWLDPRTSSALNAQLKAESRSLRTPTTSCRLNRCATQSV